MRWSKSAAKIVVAVGCCLAIAWFGILNYRVTVIPARTQFAGSVDVLFRGKTAEMRQVRSMLTIAHGLATTGDGRVQIELAVCGPIPNVDGVFVFAGNARLSHPVKFVSQGRLESVLMPVTVLLSAGQIISTDPINIYQFHLEGVPLCVPPESGQSSVPLGAGITLGGDGQKALVNQSGVRYWITPPNVGFIPMTYSSARPFGFESVSGTYWRNLDRTNQIRIESPGRFDAEFSQSTPPVAQPSGNPLLWTAKSSLKSSARLIDADAQASAQNLLIVASIVLGIAGSLLATMTWEFLSDRQRVPVANLPIPSPVGTDRKSHVLTDALGVLAGLILGTIFRRGRRKNS